MVAHSLHLVRALVQAGADLTTVIYVVKSYNIIQLIDTLTYFTAQ